MLSGGSGEMEAARLRLAAAKSNRDSALEMVESAQDMNKTAEVMTSSARFMMNEAESMEMKAQSMMNEAKAMMDTSKSMAFTARTNTESAKAMASMAKNNMTAGQSQLDTTNKEIIEAEAMLKRVEEKWQVIDVDDSPKKPEKSSDATTDNNYVNGANQTEAGDIIDVSSLASTRSLASTQSTLSDIIDVDAEIAAGLYSGNGHSLSVAVAASCNFNTQQVSVEGCGTNGANGTYKRDPNFINQYLLGDPNFIGSTHYNSFTRKKKQSSRNTYALYRKDMYWYLSIWTNHSVSKTLYRTMNKSNTGLPPENGWMTIDGESPAPKLSM